MEIKKVSQRKWRCFVCGGEHADYESYAAHIVEKHDQGREYVSCPVCQAPVRDLKSHFSTKHPNRLLPENVQYKVTVWYDFSANGKRKARKPKVRSGSHHSPKMNLDIPYRSGYEEEVYTLLDRDQEVVSYFAEPFRVPYQFQGEWHDYIPDIRVNFSDGRTEIWEVKPATQTGPDYPQNRAKWIAMESYAENLGWDFTVVTEVGINKLRAKVNQQV